MIPDLNKLCYIKFGNVCDELRHAIDAPLITGGHDHYVYATHHALGTRTKILYLSLNRAADRFDTLGRTAKNLKIYEKPTPLGKTAGLLAGTMKLLFELIRFRPDHILMVRTHALFPCYLFSRMVKAGFTVSVHNDLAIGHPLLLRLEGWTLRKADAVICHGPYLYNQVCRLRGASSVIQYNASAEDIKTPPDPCAPPVRLALPDREASWITYIGRMEEEKGIFDLYEAFKAVHAGQDNSFCLCFAGSGSHGALLRQAIRNDGLEHRVRVLGQIPRPAVAELIRRSWVVVTPTQTRFPEGRCMAAMEALALEVPLIAPKFGPFLHLVDHEKNGLFYRPDSVADLSEVLRQIASKQMRERLVSYIATCDVNQGISYGEAVRMALSGREIR